MLSVHAVPACLRVGAVACVHSEREQPDVAADGRRAAALMAAAQQVVQVCCEPPCRCRSQHAAQLQDRSAALSNRPDLQSPGRVHIPGCPRVARRCWGAERACAARRCTCARMPRAAREAQRARLRQCCPSPRRGRPRGRPRGRRGSLRMHLLFSPCALPLRTPLTAARARSRGPGAAHLGMFRPAATQWANRS